MSTEETDNQVSGITSLIAFGYAVMMFIIYYFCWGREFLEFIRGTAVIN